MRGFYFYFCEYFVIPILRSIFAFIKRTFKKHPFVFNLLNHRKLQEEHLPIFYTHTTSDFF